MKTKLIPLSICLVALVIQACGREAANIPPAEPIAPSIESRAAALEKTAAVEGSKALPSALQTIGRAEVQTIDPTGAERMDDAITCLSRTIYWEARGDGAASMEAVASVVMNRLGHEGFPSTICGVVMQGPEQGVCQFSWWCDGRSDKARDEDAYAITKEITRKALNRQLTDRTNGALYFHQRNVSPHWSTGYIKTVEVGEFVFYKPRDGTAR